MILVQKPSQAVYYFDNSVYSNQQVTRLEIDLMLKGSVTTTNPPGTFTLNYTDYSLSPSGTNESILVNFERLADSTLVAKGNYTIYGRIVINSASISISSPDNVSYSVSSYYDLDRGQSLLISNEKIISEMKGNANIPDKLVFSYGGNNLTFEYTGLSGEGQISKGSAGNYYYNYYLKDHLGSTRMVINDAGYVTDAIMYQPYGTMEEVAGIATPGVDPERERFTGKEFDREGRDSVNGIAGLSVYYFGARFHDPEIGMWRSVDPADQFWNAYSYTGCNPINRVDPDGRAVMPDDFIGPLEEGDMRASELGLPPDTYIADVMITGDLMGDEVNNYVNYLSMFHVDRTASEPFYTYQVEDSWWEIPPSVRGYEPDNLWGMIVDDMGNHTRNQRLPGGYHITEDAGYKGVWVHRDAYDATLGIGENMKHYQYEVKPNPPTVRP